MNKRLFVVSKGMLIPEYEINAEIIEIQALCNRVVQDEKICISGEACLEVVFARLEEGKIKRAVEILKNKFLFRSAIAERYPDFNYSKIELKDLINVRKKSVIKPVKGFFSAGVRILEPDMDLALIKQEIASDMDRLGDYFSDAVLSKEEWLLEDYLEGEELAVDMYYAVDGSPVILNILNHPMPVDLHYLNVIYWTSEDLFQKWRAELEDFFRFLNERVLNVANFPIHAEFRIFNGRLVPIELNPLRFGGFGLGDLSYYGLGFNPYDMFFEGKAPDWEAIWKKRKGKQLCWVLAYNGKEIDVSRHIPNHDAFLGFCGSKNVLYYRPVNWQKQPVFAIAYVALDHFKDIDRFLTLDFNQFFSPCSSG